MNVCVFEREREDESKKMVVFALFLLASANSNKCIES